MVLLLSLQRNNCDLNSTTRIERYKNKLYDNFVVETLSKLSDIFCLSKCVLSLLFCSSDRGNYGSYSSNYNLQQKTFISSRKARGTQRNSKQATYLINLCKWMAEQGDKQTLLRAIQMRSCGKL